MNADFSQHFPSGYAVIDESQRYHRPRRTTTHYMGQGQIDQQTIIKWVVIPVGTIAVLSVAAGMMRGRRKKRR